MSNNLSRYYALTTTRVMPLSAASSDLTRTKLAASGVSDMLLFMPYSHFKDTRLQRTHSAQTCIRMQSWLAP
ncbi:hypothetical protein BKA82DRAFT_1003013 [Pisolithus tinctorius]|uniref:Uncharacterized protein n=1 Tax=Pisolithus tinctorius Marx 270 TaxID=870435 RepID=A0A0C3P2A6_PISTI|nr:hypothetical protein BKA82DRAFT_1003013 [Pisolithus tinctorius]KIO01621.1 hypothetical protein M404DRAFT_1003013 [Pisolithus tinctorius Marx 270]